MENKFQIGNRGQFVLVVIFAVMTSLPGQPLGHFQSPFNASFEPGTNELLKPIILPNLTYQEKSITSQPKTEDPLSKIKNVRNDTALLLRKLFPKDSGRALSEHSTVQVPYEEEVTKASPYKFSSRYSKKPELYNMKNAEESQEEEEETKEEIEESTERIQEATEDDESDREPDTSNLEEEEEEEEKQDTQRTYEPEAEEIEPTRTAEPETRRSTSFSTLVRTRHHDDDDDYRYETSSPASEGNAKDGNQSEEVNYNSVQTPLSDIQFRGAHVFNDNSDNDEPRQRLVPPIRRHPISFHWPFSPAYRKAQQNKVNKQWSVEVPHGPHPYYTIRTTSAPIEKAVEKDQSQQAKKFGDFGRKAIQEQQNAVIVEEGKDRAKQYTRSKQEEVEKVQVSPKPSYLSKDIWSTSSSIVGQTERYQVFDKPDKREDKRYWKNATKPKNSHKYLGSVTFEQSNDEEEHPGSEHTTNDTSNNLQQIEEKESIDQKSQKDKPRPLTTAEDTSSQSFNYLEESDELYNQILANIQSVFGMRTQPLKSRQAKGEPKPEDSKRSLSWTLPWVKPKAKISERKFGSDSQTTPRTSAIHASTPKVSPSTARPFGVSSVRPWLLPTTKNYVGISTLRPPTAALWNDNRSPVVFV